MKITYFQLAQQLNKPKPPGIWILSGDETLLAEEARDLIREKAKILGYSERVKIPTEESDWGSTFFSEAQSLSLFANKRLIEIDLRNQKMNAANAKIILDYAAQPNEDAWILIQFSKLDAKTEQSKWCKALESQGIFVTIRPMTKENLPQWLIQRARQYQLTLSPTQANSLAEQVEGNLLAASQEIEKLYLLSLDQPGVDLEMIYEDHAHFDIFDLVSEALTGNTQKALHVLKNLFKEGIEPTLILWAITRELRLINELILGLKKGLSIGLLFKQLQVWEKRQAGIHAFLKRHNALNCQSFLSKAAYIDQMIKGVTYGNSRIELEQFILAISGNDILKLSSS